MSENLTNNAPDNNKQSRPFWLKVVMNLLAMLAICIGLFLIISYWLDLWTHHGAEISVPDVKGMYYDEARALLEDQDFEVVLQDSVYEENIKPGSVVEQNPTSLAVVKPGRTVYLTINAFYPRTIPFPTMTDISERQAMTTLEGIGFKNVTVHLVPSEYDGLVFGVLVNGKRIKPGTRVPLTARIVLEVGSTTGYVDSTLVNANSVVDTVRTESVATDAPEEHTPDATITTTNASEPAADDDDNDIFD